MLVKSVMLFVFGMRVVDVTLFDTYRVTTVELLPVRPVVVKDAVDVVVMVESLLEPLDKTTPFVVDKISLVVGGVRVTVLFIEVVCVSVVVMALSGVKSPSSVGNSLGSVLKPTSVGDKVLEDSEYVIVEDCVVLGRCCIVTLCKFSVVVFI